MLFRSREAGTVRLAIAPGCEGEVAAVLNDLSPEIRMEPRETTAGARGSVERS